MWMWPTGFALTDGYTWACKMSHYLNAETCFAETCFGTPYKNWGQISLSEGGFRCVSLA